jgi:diguanylate cyclase (GGDEF)-like protein
MSGGVSPAASLAAVWQTLALANASGVDDLSLIVADKTTSSASGMYFKLDWVRSWVIESQEDAAAALAQARAEGASRAILSSVNAAGTPSIRDVALSRLAGHDVILSIARDVTSQLTEENRLRRVAYHDGLTGLMNRNALRDHLACQIAELTGTDGSIAVLLLDLDNFKLINDTLGHDAGDAVLVEAAKRLSAVAPTSSAVGRLGGDEFVVIVKSAEEQVAIADLAEAITETMREPMLYRGRAFDTRASIGVATFPRHGTDPAELLKNADIALYAAKAFGRGGFTTYVPSMANTLRKRAATILSVREAIAQHRIEVFYQPKVDLAARRIIGFEALLRMRGSDGSLIEGHALDQAFDDIELARQIGDTMFDRVAFDVEQWSAASVPFGRVALNASAAEFRGGDFATRLLDKLRARALSPALFEIEVSETVLASRATDFVASAIEDLSDAGVHVVLDNFGTGCSSLSQLKRLPFNSLKIDQTFVAALESSQDDKATVRAIAGLADGLGLAMTAVGVQTSGQVEALTKLGCQYGQGDLLGPPTPSGDIINTGTPFLEPHRSNDSGNE